jgi:hypothetical protein
MPFLVQSYLLLVISYGRKFNWVTDQWMDVVNNPRFLELRDVRPTIIVYDCL